MTELYYNAEPVFRVGGQQVGITQDAIRIEVCETTEGLKTLSLWLLAQGPTSGADQADLLYLDGQTLDFGQTIEVAIGSGADARTIFKGDISAIQADLVEGKDPEVRVFAEDKLMRLRMSRRCRTYDNKSDADIASAIADIHSLRAQVAADGPTYDYVQQWNQSDLAFLRERARLIQAEVFVRDDTLYFQTRGNRNATALTLVQGETLISAQMRADLAHQRSKVTVSGFDAQARDQISSDAGTSEIKAEVASGRTGQDVLKKAFAYDESKGEGVTLRVREAPLKGGEADAWARAETLRRARSFVSVTGMTNGTPDLEVGSTLTLARVGRPFNGDGYYTTSVRHTWDRATGHRTHFEAERATLSEDS
jgi:phage protein D